MKTLPIIFLLTFFSVFANAAEPTRWYSDFTVRQVEDGVRAQGVHIVHLSCNKADCFLSMVTLNQCIAGSFVPKVETFSTRESPFHEGLKVLKKGADEWLVEIEVIPGSPIQLRLVAPCQKNYGDICNREVKQVSGSMTKNSVILDKLITINYERVPTGAKQQLDCKAQL